MTPPPLEQHACLACGFLWAMPVFDGGQQPLATLAWPESEAASLGLDTFPLYFLRCMSCGHVYNRDFTYDDVPYINHPNRMYNASPLWQEHIQHLVSKIRPYLPESPTVVEIGCGEGAFLRALAASCEGGQFIGFDPNQTPDGADEHQNTRVSRRAELFLPHQHMQELRPDLILSRHVLEHLMNPLAFVQEIAFHSALHQVDSTLFFEVPCIDRAMAYGRIEDLYYEHNSHFTRRSFESLLGRLSGQALLVEQGYNDEVIYGLVRLQDDHTRRLVDETLNFKQHTHTARKTLKARIQKLGEPLVLWGGTGKAAAFIHHFALQELPFHVVDSDPHKWGTFVPGTRFKIHDPESLTRQAPAAIIIPPQWRAHDIHLEIQRRQLEFKALYIEHQGLLVNFLEAPHPYHNTKK